MQDNFIVLINNHCIFKSTKELHEIPGKKKNLEST